MVSTSFFESQPGLQATTAWTAAFARSRGGVAAHPIHHALPAFRRGGFGMTLALTTPNQSRVAP